MSFTQAVASGFLKYVTFAGRAARSEFWYWILFTMLAGLATEVLDHFFASSGEPSSAVFALVTFLPGLAVTVRRLHDTDRSGWWLLLFLVPVVNFVLIVWFCFEGTQGYNRFGADPYGSGGHIAAELTAAQRVRAEAWRRRASR